MSHIDHAPLITSAANPTVKNTAKLLARKGRRDQKRFLIEGYRAVTDGKSVIDELFVTEDCANDYSSLIEEIVNNGAKLHLVTNEVLSSITDTVTPQGIVGVAPINPARLEDVLATKPRLLIVLDQVSDPGNAGTILRTADAAGADAVIYLSGSTDPYSPKASRSSVGSIFHLPVVVGAEGVSTIEAIKAAGIKCFGTQVHGAESLFEQDFDGSIALVFGGEANGMSTDVKDAIDKVVSIPMPATERPGYSGHAESLNLAAAAAIMTFAASKELGI